MKYFNNPQTLEELKTAYRTLAMQHHPDKGGSKEAMQVINAEYDILFPILKNRHREQTGEDIQDTAQSTRREFYTQNGWEGTNYDRTLSTKDIAARIREYAKQAWPTYRFSVTTQYFSGGSSISITLTEGPEEVLIDPTDEKYIQVNHYNIEKEDRLTEAARHILSDVYSFAISYNYDDSDGMIDYHDTNFYLDINVGRWDKPFKVVPRTSRIKSAPADIVPSATSQEHEQISSCQSGKEYDYLTPNPNCDYKIATDNIRRVLKHNFPNQKFSVCRRNLDSVFISWEDGPTNRQVKSAVRMFEGLKYDGMTDSTDILHSDFISLYGCVGYMFYDRDMSDGVRDALLQEINTRFGCSYSIGDYCELFLRDMAEVVRREFYDRDFTPTAAATETPVQTDGIEIVDYSEKAVAMFGDTKAIKDTLKRVGGRFNPALSRGGEKCPGWVFPKTKEAELRDALKLA